MAKKQAKKPMSQTKAPPKPRTGKNLNVWLSPELMDAFNRHRRMHKRSKTAEVEFVFEDFYRRQGLLPGNYGGSEDN